MKSQIKKILSILEASVNKKGQTPLQLTPKLIKKGIEILLSVSEPQDGCFIGSFDLARDYNLWKKECLKEILDPTEEAIVLTMLSHFEQNVKGDIIEDIFYRDSDEEEPLFQDEKVHSVAKLAKFSVKAPNAKFTHFKLLPVDYNRGGNDIGIAFFTPIGAKFYSKSVTGDY